MNIHFIFSMLLLLYNSEFALQKGDGYDNVYAIKFVLGNKMKHKKNKQWLFYSFNHILKLYYCLIYLRHA